jgi:predicted dehydrogenase
MIALVIGLGIGNLYVHELQKLGYSVDTVDTDINKNPTYLSMDQIELHYDITIICTPNWTHETLARKIAEKSSIVFVEKPGVKDSASWIRLVNDYPNTRFMMIKNNQYRSTMDYFKDLAKQSESVQIVWSNNNRIPYPGGWFTTKDLAFGGVSRDLMPHMLSYYCVLSDYRNGKKINVIAEQRHVLESIKSTDYGTINTSGVYDVDDFCKFEFENNKEWVLVADWDNGSHSDLFIEFDDIRIDLGLCPEDAYKKMIETAVQNLYNDEFWKEQLSQDTWIHEQIEML